MITKNFKTLISYILQAAQSNSPGLTELNDLTGGSRYLSHRISSFPLSVNNGVVFTGGNTSSGISVGSGSTPATENDYKLENIITSGLSASSTTETRALDNDGNPYLYYTFILTNNSASNITIAEIGYAQILTTTSAYNTTTGIATQRAFLLDRTVLDNPITILPNGSAAIRYELKTLIS